MIEFGDALLVVAGIGVATLVVDGVAAMHNVAAADDVAAIVGAATAFDV